MKTFSLLYQSDNIRLPRGGLDGTAVPVRAERAAAHGPPSSDQSFFGARNELISEESFSESASRFTIRSPPVPTRARARFVPGINCVAALSKAALLSDRVSGRQTNRIVACCNSASAQACVSAGMIPGRAAEHVKPFFTSALMDSGPPPLAHDSVLASPTNPLPPTRAAAAIPAANEPSPRPQ